MAVIGIGSTAMLPYVGVLLAAIVEGEVAYIGAATLVAHGVLHPLGVLVAGAFGAAIGDQAYFYAFRGRLPRWIARFPTLSQRAAPLVARVKRHDSLMVLLIRFSPGLRIAIAAACAWVDVAPLKFSGLNLISAFAWATVLLTAIAWLGPAGLGRIGLSAWQGALLAGIVLFAVMKAFGAYERRTLEGHDHGRYR
jgi:membrane protein DedA with SNARE-associated domain